MTAKGELSPSLAGAEVLSKLARQRASGLLDWGRAAGAARLELAEGRPVRGQSSDGQASATRESLTLLVRSFACSLSGSYQFTQQKIAAAEGVDPLGEALVAVLTAMTEPQLMQVWQARSNLAVAPSSAFEPIRAACMQLGFPDVQVAFEGERLTALLLGASMPAQRTLAALLLLEGLSAKPVQELAPPPSTLPPDPKARELVAEIDAAYDRMQQQSFYELLGVPRDADADAIRKRYLELAKRWHSDRFAGLELGERAAKAEEIFRRIAEAQRILSDGAQRKAYDFVLERHAQGLPTEAGVILEAEAVFKKAQGLVRRGQAAAALPLLERAVELNKGEPEFWIYLGYALYSAKGKAALGEAEANIRHGLEMRDKLDVGYEFLGRIARVEGCADDARKNFRRALELNPKNLEAERELRLMTMRSGKTTAEVSSLGELLNRWLKKH
jgi:curved DNA-binding protein CbpA